MKHSLIKIIGAFMLFIMSKSLMAMDSFDFVAACDKRIIYISNKDDKVYFL